MRKQLIVDIGRFAISYSVINELDLRLEYFKIDLMADIDYLFAERGISFIAKVVDVTRSILGSYSDIDSVLYVIPSKDVLLVSSKALTVDNVLTELNKSFRISEIKGLNQSVGRPYRHKGKYYTPVSLYDAHLDILIKELNLRDDVNKDDNKLRSDIYFQTTLGRMTEKAKISIGRVAIVDAGFSSTRVLFSDNGVPTSFVELQELNGEAMLQYVHSKTEAKLEDIVNITINSRNLRQNNIEEVLLADEYIEDQSKNFRNLINKYPLDEIIIYGGLSAMDLVGPTETPVTIMGDIDRSTKEVPNHFKYRIAYNGTTTHEGGIMDPKNLDVLMGKSEYTRVKEIGQIEDDNDDFEDEIIDENRQNQNSKRSKSTSNTGKSRKKGPVENDENLEESISKNPSTPKKRKGLIQKVMPAAEIVPEEITELWEKDHLVEKVEIENIDKMDEDELDKLKKKQKKFSKRESIYPAIVIAIVMAFVLAGSVVIMNELGWVSVKPLEKLGIMTSDRRVEVDIMYTAIRSTVSSVVNDFEIHPSRVAVKTSYHPRKRQVTGNVGVPLDFEDHDIMVKHLLKRLGNLGLDKEVVVEEIEDDGQTYRVLLFKTVLNK